MAKKISQKEKTPMPCLDPSDRRSSFEEVAAGYTLSMAVQEASRCIECRNRPCVAGCPVEIDIPRFVAEIARGPISTARSERSAIAMSCLRSAAACARRKISARRNARLACGSSRSR
jgi:hypothetical protein